MERKSLDGLPTIVADTDKVPQPTKNPGSFMVVFGP